MRITLKPIVIQSLCVHLCIFASRADCLRTKRIIGGRDLPDHNLYNTHYLVSLQLTFKCVSNQFDHKMADCENHHKCGGSLITPDFVLTACHCLVFENWYVGPLPPARKIALGDLPPYIEDRMHNRPRTKGDPLVHRKEVFVMHPLWNTLTAFAGHPESRNKATQRRHSAKFFIHHLCAKGEQLKYPELWVHDHYELDIGLVKTCFPFHLDKNVQLAPLRPLDKMEEHFHRMADLSFTCLFTGWGYALRKNSIGGILGKGLEFYTEVPDILQHAFRYIQCNRDCVVDRHQCLMCSSHHGRLSAMQRGDSGSPVVCDGYVTALHSSAAIGRLELNYTTAVHVAVACVKDFISPGHLSYLRSLTPYNFHYIDGNPVPWR